MYVAVVGAVAVAMLRHGLFDVDRVISRAIAWGALSLVLVGLFAIVALAVAIPLGGGSAVATALAALASLRVKGRAAKSGYEREVFGHAWADVDRNGCDTRNDILRRDLTAYVLKAGTRGCLVLRGRLRDPYTGNTIGFVRGETAHGIRHGDKISNRNGHRGFRCVIGYVAHVGPNCRQSCDRSFERDERPSLMDRTYDQ